MSVFFNSYKMEYAILIVAVFIGVLLAQFVNNSKKVTDLLLMFSGAYLLCVTLLHILPLIYQKANIVIWAYIIVGIILQMILEGFSKGVEHGHVHQNEKLSFSIAVGLMFHAFLEGMPVGDYHEHGNILLAVAIHKIPVATILFFYVNSIFTEKYKIYLVMLLFAFMTPLGTLVSQNAILTKYSFHILALVSGVFIHISTTILFENSNSSHRISWVKLVMIVASSVLILLT